MLLNQILKCKLHHARVTFCDREYPGSIAIDSAFMDAAGILDGELLHIWAVDHMSRIQTYAIRSDIKGAIGLNGGAANFFNVGDRLVIAAFAMTDQPIEPKILVLDAENNVVSCT